MQAHIHRHIPWHIETLIFNPWFRPGPCWLPGSRPASSKSFPNGWPRKSSSYVLPLVPGLPETSTIIMIPPEVICGGVQPTCQTKANRPLTQKVTSKLTIWGHNASCQKLLRGFSGLRPTLAYPAPPSQPGGTAGIMPVAKRGAVIFVKLLAIYSWPSAPACFHMAYMIWWAKRFLGPSKFQFANKITQATNHCRAAKILRQNCVLSLQHCFPTEVAAPRFLDRLSRVRSSWQRN